MSTPITPVELPLERGALGKVFGRKSVVDVYVTHLFTDMIGEEVPQRALTQVKTIHDLVIWVKACIADLLYDTPLSPRKRIREQKRIMRRFGYRLTLLFIQSEVTPELKREVRALVNGKVRHINAGEDEDQKALAQKIRRQRKKLTNKLNKATKAEEAAMLRRGKLELALRRLKKRCPHLRVSRLEDEGTFVCFMCRDCGADSLVSRNADLLPLLQERYEARKRKKNKKRT